MTDNTQTKSDGPTCHECGINPGTMTMDGEYICAACRAKVWTCDGPYEKHETSEKRHTHQFFVTDENGHETGELTEEQTCSACWDCCPI